jgi:hypothetical protein
MVWLARTGCLVRTDRMAMMVFQVVQVLTV